MNGSKIRLFGLIVLLGALPVSSAMAGELSAVINGKSYHLNSTNDWNEDNYGFGIEYAFESQSRWKKIAMANGFLDSNSNMSYMVGAGLHRRLIETDRLSGFYVDAGINAFVMTREDVNDNRPFPGLLPSLSIGNQNVGFNLTYLPKKMVQDYLGAEMADPTIRGILFLQFKVNTNLLRP
jgi:hypothetical protein